MVSENLEPAAVGAVSLPFSPREKAGRERLQAAPEDWLHFDILRDDQVRASSTRFYGGMWRWRLCNGDGTVFATSAEYRSEEACKAALAIIRRHAGTASFHTD